MNILITNLKRAWQMLRRLSGDDAYEQYLKQHIEHAHDEPPLTKEAFFKEWQDKKWKGIKRCC